MRMNFYLSMEDKELSNRPNEDLANILRRLADRIEQEVALVPDLHTGKLATCKGRVVGEWKVTS